MIKRITLLLLLLLNIFSYSQEQKENKEPFQNYWKIELLYTSDIINSSFGKHTGFIFKGKRKFFDAKHFDFLYGIAYQNSYISETHNPFTSDVKGYTRDIGLYSVFEVKYFPFKKKKLNITLEPFIGITHLKSKGILKIPEFSIYEKYENNYAYFNYGFSQSVGFDFNRFSVSGFAWVSLKGILDKGRFRPGDFDSKLFIGLGFGYTFM